MTETLTQEVLERFEKITKRGTLQYGGHNFDHEAGMCVMEATAYIAGEAWTDHPSCVHPFLTDMAIWINDGMSTDADRALLIPYIPRMIGTANGTETSERLAWSALDYTVRTTTPQLLDLLKLTDEASQLRTIVEITDWDTAKAAVEFLVSILQKALALALEEQSKARLELLDRMLVAIGR